MKGKYSYAPGGAIILLVLIIFIFFIKPWGHEANTNKKVMNTKQSFEIYLVKDKESALKARTHGYWDWDTGKYINGIMDDVNGNIVDINSLLLEDKPVLTDKDILKYDWTNHEIEVTKEYVSSNGISADDWSKRVVSGGSAILKSDYKGSFVIVVNGKRVYSGGFPLYMESSQSPSEIGIRDIANYKIRIWNSKAYSDVRNNKDIYNVFKSKGKLIEPKDKFSQIDAIKKVKEKFPDLEAYPMKEGKKKVVISLGGKETSKKIPGEFEISVVEGRNMFNDGKVYDISFIEYWDSKDFKPEGAKDGVLNHYQVFTVKENEVNLLKEGGALPPEAAK